MEFDRTDPIGSVRGDINAATISKTIADVNRGKQRAPYKLQDFIPSFGPKEQPRQLSPEEMLDRIRQVNAQLGGVEISRSRGLVDPRGNPIGAVDG